MNVVGLWLSLTAAMVSLGIISKAARPATNVKMRSFTSSIAISVFPAFNNQHHLHNIKIIFNVQGYRLIVVFLGGEAQRDR
jgi:hypothetical protein